ncbi:hypothetical protein N1851_026906 [Merluccius polli]|uniref:DDE Tnp4 domain-containing protein n=1 Tax=Merluccius polli TaxID=89951 RepID=A0AA47MB42_MERPO|nr:hypothetical protein N1851_026906 [Merluccius polli]
MFGNTTIFSNRENATLQCRRFRNIATIIYPVSFGQSTTTQEDQSQLHGSRYAGVVGAVDGTHIGLQIIAPSKDEDVFPAGSTRDPRILMGSGLRREVPVGCHLLGDSGYPCKTS